jgi:hypothetical protein
MGGTVERSTFNQRLIGFAKERSKNDLTFVIGHLSIFICTFDRESFVVRLIFSTNSASPLLTLPKKSQVEIEMAK